MNKKEYYETKYNIKTYPKSVIDNIYSKKQTKRRKSTFSLQNNDLLPIIENTTSVISDISPIFSNIKSGLHISHELTSCILMFNKLQNTKIVDVDDVQTIISMGQSEKEMNNKIFGSFFNFIDMFMPFTVARKTYDVVGNLMSVNTEHAKVTLLVLNKWRKNKCIG